MTWDYFFVVDNNRNETTFNSAGNGGVRFTLVDNHNNVCEIDGIELKTLEKLVKHICGFWIFI